MHSHNISHLSNYMIKNRQRLIKVCAKVKLCTQGSDIWGKIAVCHSIFHVK